MTYQEAIKELEIFKNERGIGYYKQTFGDNSNYLGLGLTQLRKIAKKIKIDVSLAEKLMKSKYFEAKMLSLMVDDPLRYDKKSLEILLKDLPDQISESPLSYFTLVFTEYIVAKSPDAEEVNNVKDAMNNSLLSWGQRNISLHSKILKSLKKIGEVNVDYGETSCQTPDVLKILSSKRIIQKLS